MAEPDDLFEKSKMSFGQHLEELRGALVKSLLAIAIGFGIGLYFAPMFVRYVEGPLNRAVDRHVLNDAREKYIDELKQRKADGEPVPDDLEAAADVFIEQGLAPRRIYIDPELLKIESDENLVPITIFEYVKDDPRRVIGTGVTQGFMVFVKAALVLGLIIASPFVFYFIWQFVAAGLYPHERRYVKVFLPFSIGLFLAGAAVAFYGALHFVLEFLFWFYEVLDIAPYPVINEWMSFILILPLGFGISFQLPLVMLFLERIGIFTVENYLKQWKVAVIVICIISTVLTPADPQSMILMAVPLVGLYFGGVGLCRYMPRRQTPFGTMADQ
ncbi:twin-arginine translocase subunit TatC [Aeoliella sp. ICT_H6.2]|uniref:Sec-independent protein translocase protein TatC n=1 Tax=Aeoliella straminimaris TaxID=2954799 RepID=A0A9X2FEG7_9BACT|nr:twin-arginine translocase subunit TatC [Aeoliella straminimaris]MCO6047535.1 twin-arginine translocase subunit TatC [Aeoliella straminimaris]